MAARGLDIAALPAVFNFDIPFGAEDYVHRIGRTGRAGASGLAVSLVTSSDARLMADIEKLIKKKIEVEPFELEGERRPQRESRYEERSEARPAASFSPDAERSEAPREAGRPTRPVRPAYRRAESADPFFNKPYEPAPDADPVWEDKNAGPSTGAGSSVSRVINKPKRKVAALLGGPGSLCR